MVTEGTSAALLRSKCEPEAFSLIYNEHFEALVIFMTRRVYDVSLALDLAAESLAQAFLSRRRFRGTTDAEVTSWLYGIASRQLALYFRRSAVEQRALQRLGLEPPRLTGQEEEERLIELAGLDQLRTSVRSELRRLSDEQREALQLRIVDELPYGEVAERLGITQQAARARVARGLKTLATVLDRYQPPLREGLT